MLKLTNKYNMGNYGMKKLLKFVLLLTLLVICPTITFGIEKQTLSPQEMVDSFNLEVNKYKEINSLNKFIKNINDTNLIYDIQKTIDNQDKVRFNQYINIIDKNYLNSHNGYIFYLIKADLYSGFEDANNAILNYEKFLDSAKNSLDKSASKYLYDRLASLSLEQKQYDKFLNYIKNSLNIEQESISYILLTEYYVNIQNDKKAIEEINNAIKLSKFPQMSKKESLNALAKAYSLRGLLQVSNGKYQLGMDDLKMAKKIYIKNDEKKELATLEKLILTYLNAKDAIFIDYINKTQNLDSDYLFTSYHFTQYNDIDKVAKQIKTKDKEKIEKELFWVLSNNKNTVEYNLCIGEFQLQKGDINLAEFYLTKAYNLSEDKYYLNQNKYLIYNELAKVYLKKQNYIKALKYSDMAMNSKKLEKEFIATRIEIYKLSKLSSSRNIVKKDIFINDIPNAISLKDDISGWSFILKLLEYTDNITSEYTWGEVFGFTKKQRESSKEKDSFKSSAYLLKIKILSALGYYEDASSLMGDLLYSIQVNNSNDKLLRSKAYWLKGIILCEYDNDYKNSIVALTNAIEQDPTNYQYYLYRSLAYLKNRELSFAVLDIDKCIELNPNNNVPYEYKANYLERLGKRGEALNLYKKALALNPASSSAKNNINRIQNNIKKEQDEIKKYPNVDTHTRTRLQVSANMVEEMKNSGFIKKIQSKSNIMVFFVSEKIWLNLSAEGLYNTIDTIEEYSLLRGCDYSEFRSSSNGRLLYKHRANVRDLNIN